jgi:hypothetical protein
MVVCQMKRRPNGSVPLTMSPLPSPPSVALQFLALARSRQPPLNDGTTALTALIVGNTVYVANGAHVGGFVAYATLPHEAVRSTRTLCLPCCPSPFLAIPLPSLAAGDSRAVLVHEDGYPQPLSDDHKPTRRDEVARIVAVRGDVARGKDASGVAAALPISLAAWVVHQISCVALPIPPHTSRAPNMRSCRRAAACCSTASGACAACWACRAPSATASLSPPSSPASQR